MSLKEKSELLQEFQYCENGHVESWPVGEKYASSAFLGPGRRKSINPLFSAQGERVRQDAKRQGVELRCEKQEGCSISSGRDEEVYWPQLHDWMQASLQAAGVQHNREKMAALVISASFCDQKFNISLGMFLYLMTPITGELSRILDDQQQTCRVETKAVSDRACTAKTYNFKVTEAGDLCGCSVIIEANTSVDFIVSSQEPEKEIFRETIQVSEKTVLTMDFSDSASLYQSVEIDVKGDSLVYSILKKGMQCVIAGEIDKIKNIPFFAEGPSLFDQAKKCLESNIVRQFIAHRFGRNNRNIDSYEEELGQYADILLKEMKNKFDPNRAKKEKKLKAVFILQKHMKLPSLQGVIRLSEYQNLLSGGRLGALFKIYRQAAGSYETKNLDQWFELEMLLYQGKPIPNRSKQAVSAVSLFAGGGPASEPSPDTRPAGGGGSK